MSNIRNVYLAMNTLADAKNILFNKFSHLERLSGEKILVPDSVGRVLAEPVFARLSSPNFHAAAMDGIAVKAETTFGASETNPKKLIVNKDIFFLNTGHVLPENTNSVIMIENVNIIDENSVEIEMPAVPWQHVRKMGEDIVATELLFAQNHVITPYCVGALLSGGIFSVSVRKKPKAIIIPTGSELVDWENSNIDQLKPGQIFETNSFVLGKMVESTGGIYERYDKIADDTDRIKEAVLKAVNADCDIVLVLGGSSAGSEDYAKKVISDIGEVFIHGVTMMPGKPVVIGKVKNKPVFGIPGYPVSAIVAFEQLVQPIICKLLGQPEKERQKIQVVPAKKITSKLGVEEFLRVKLGKVGERIIATSLPRGAGCITTITEADGIIRIPNNVEGINAQEPVTAELIRPLSSINNTIVVVGSHDNSLDILADSMKAGQNSLTLSSSHVGSMGGLMAIKNGACHIAGSHLLDTTDGSYNISYIKRYLPDIKVKLVHLVFRDQGLIVAKGNPKNINGIEDLARKDIKFINRQGGSGTRILLDYRLNQLGINPAQINGYDNEEFTHMSVAVNILSGAIDVGLGIFAAAKALGLDFIPVVTEQYDLVIPEIYFETENIKILLDIINSAEFKKHVETLGGYSTKKTGEILL
ncbi:MAG: molybdopterin biosynthesis protein [Proteobacteria bacterium]|nr:molybdopterin biosynthesis protein [Pseudomonadota bacterium]